MNESSVIIHYKNWRGEVAFRTVIPRRIYFDANEYHPEPQWLMEAWDVEKQALRNFALLDIKSWNKGPKQDEPYK